MDSGRRTHAERLFGSRHLYGGASRRDASNRGLQLIIGIVCMVMIANLQYGWTLFVHPMSVAHGWAVADIQIAFSLFVALETWLTPSRDGSSTGSGQKTGRG